MNSISVTLPPGSLSAIQTDPVAFDGSTSLSPDALMAYCQSRLSSIDDQVKESFAKQTRNASETKQINQVANLLKTYTNRSNVTDPASLLDIENHVHDLIAALQKSDPNCPALPQLTQTYNTLLHSGTGPTSPDHPEYPGYINLSTYPPDTGVSSTDSNLSSGELQMYAQNMTDAVASLNSDSELQMIHLQSLMSQRQTAVSLTTNLVQSLGDQENKIVANIGH